MGVEILRNTRYIPIKTGDKEKGGRAAGKLKTDLNPKFKNTFKVMISWRQPFQET